MSAIQIIQYGPVMFIHDKKIYWIDQDITSEILREKNYGLMPWEQYNDVSETEAIDYIESNNHLWQLDEQQDFSLI
jgi:hypothetical protein